MALLGEATSRLSGNTWLREKQHVRSLECVSGPAGRARAGALRRRLNFWTLLSIIKAFRRDIDISLLEHVSPSMGKRHSLRPVCAQPGRHSIRPLKDIFAPIWAAPLAARRSMCLAGILALPR
jgi:hypothetical protein